MVSSNWKKDEGRRMNADWQWVQLGEISEVISKGTTPTTHGVAFLDSGIPFLRAEDVVGGAVDVNSVKYYVDEKTHNKLLSRSQLQPGDFLITIAGSLGRVGYVPLNAPPLNCNQAVAFVRLKPNIIDLNFLLYIFQYEGITKSLLDVQKVGTIGNLNLEQIRDFKIPLPPLTEQKRIASLLARADRLRQLRRAANALADSLLQSVFLEMFGEPVANSKKWNVEKLEGFTSLVSSGATPLGGSNVYKPTGFRFIRSQNVLMNRFDFSDVVFIDEETYYSMKRTVVKRDDVLLNITGASIGRVACYQDDTPANVNQHVCIIRCKQEKLNPVYLSYVISMPSFQEKIIANQSGATRQALNFEQIKDFNIPLPPLALQEEFARIVGAERRSARTGVESLRARMAESERQAEGLFESLLSESFGG
jgi:restriction endonuclease S subunit